MKKFVYYWMFFIEYQYGVVEFGLFFNCNVFVLCFNDIFEFVKRFQDNYVIVKVDIFVFVKYCKMYDVGYVLYEVDVVRIISFILLLFKLFCCR